jgi:hypothetical protein
MESKFNLAIYNRFKAGKPIVAEFKSTSDRRRRWVAIYQPAQESLAENKVPHLFSVLDFELDIEKMEEYFSDQDMVNKRRYYADSEKDLFEVLESMDFDVSKFTYPWACDYPL